MENLNSRFANVETNALVDGETFFTELDSGKYDQV